MATGRMNKHGNIRCEGCGSYDLEVTVSYDGMDEYSEAGRGSGFEHVVELNCKKCGRIYPIVRVKHTAHVSMIKERGDRNAG